MSKREFRPQSEVTGPTYPTSDGFAPRRRHFLLGLAAGVGLALLGGDAPAGESKKPAPKKPPKKEPKRPTPPRDLDGYVVGPNAALDEEDLPFIAEPPKEASSAHREAWDAPHLVAGDHDDKKKPKGKGGKRGGDEGKKRLPPVKGDVAQPDAAVDAETQGPWEAVDADPDKKKGKKDKKKADKRPDKKKPDLPPPGVPPHPHAAIDA